MRRAVRTAWRCAQSLPKPSACTSCMRRHTRRQRSNLITVRRILRTSRFATLAGFGCPFHCSRDRPDAGTHVGPPPSCTWCLAWRTLASGNVPGKAGTSPWPGKSKVSVPERVSMTVAARPDPGSISSGHMFGGEMRDFSQNFRRARPGSCSGAEPRLSPLPA